MLCTRKPGAVWEFIAHTKGSIGPRTCVHSLHSLQLLLLFVSKYVRVTVLKLFQHDASHRWSSVAEASGGCGIAFLRM